MITEKRIFFRLLWTENYVENSNILNDYNIVIWRPHSCTVRGSKWETGKFLNILT